MSEQTMLAGPIFRTELVSAARRRRYFVVRVVYAAILLLVLWSMYESYSAMQRYSGGQTSIRQSAQLASSFFLAFSWVQLIGVIALAPALAAGTIATERERRTIEYLFATDLSNLEIIAGKVLAKLLVVGKFMLVGVPILFLFRMLGGIPANVLGASFLISASTALVLTSLGVCISVWSKRSKDATTRTYLVMLAVAIVPAILSMIGMMQFRQEPWWNDYAQPALLFLTGLNPLAVLAQSMGGMIGVGAGFNFRAVLEMATAHGVISLVLLALATTSVRRVHLRELGRGDPSAKKEKGSLVKVPRWRPALGDRPMIWKESFAPTAKSKLGFIGGIAVTLLGTVAVGSVLYAFILGKQYGNRSDYFEFVMVYSGLVGSLALLLIAARASGLVTIEKERDCWTSLLSTPLSGGEIIRGKMLGNLYAARWPAAALLFAWIVGVIANPSYLIVLVASLGTFAVCAWFVTMLGLWFSLRSSTSLRAQGMTLGTGVFVGGGYLFCCCTVFAGMGNRGGDEMMIGLAPCMPFLLAMPSVSYLNDSYNSSEEQMAMAAFIVGVIGYTVVSAILLAMMTSEFDELAGRTVESPQRPVREPGPSK